MRWLLGLCVLIPLAAAFAASLKPADLPHQVIVAAERAIPGVRIMGAERKEREGRHYYDVEGVRPDGADVELDLLQTPRGWEVVEIQRDLAWADVPKIARAAAASALGTIIPVRVIESRQTGGQIIYELFKPGAPAKPAYEVMVENGKARLLTEEWPH